MRVILKIIELIVTCVFCLVIYAVICHRTPELLSLGFEDFAAVLGTQTQYYCFESASFVGLLIAFLFGLAFGGFALPLFLLLRVLEELKKI